MISTMNQLTSDIEVIRMTLLSETITGTRNTLNRPATLNIAQFDMKCEDIAL